MWTIYIIIGIILIFYLTHSTKQTLNNSAKIKEVEEDFKNEFEEAPQNLQPLYKTLLLEFISKEKTLLNKDTKLKTSNIISLSVINILNDIKDCNLFEEMNISFDDWISLFNSHSFWLDESYEPKENLDKTLLMTSRMSAKDQKTFLLNVKHGKHIAW